MSRFLLAIYDYFHSHRVVFRLLLFFLVVLFGVLASQITLQEDISGFMPKNKDTEKINYVSSNISVANKIIVRISLTDTTASADDMMYDLETCADQFVVNLDSIVDTTLIKSVIYKADGQAIVDIMRFLTQNMPYFLSETDYSRMDSLINGDVNQLIATDRDLLVSPIGMGVKDNILLDPLHFSSSLLSQLKGFQIGDNYRIVDDYIFTSDGRSIMLFVESANSMSETHLNTILYNQFEEAINKLDSQHYKIDYFGGCFVAVANANQIKKDSFWTIIIAGILILIILFSYFREVKSIFLIVVPVLFGALFALAVFSLFKGTISAIAIGAGSIILGIAVNYSMHYLIHRKEHNDPRQSIKEIATPMLIGNITTVGAFLSLLFISAESMKDFGLFAALALVGTILFVLVFLPHLSFGQSKPVSHPFYTKISDYQLENHRLLIGLVLVVTIVLYFFSGRVNFDADMQKINYMTEKQREDFNELTSVSTLGKKNIFLVAEGKTEEEALRVYEKQQTIVNELKTQHRVASSHGIGIYLPSDSLQKVNIARWNEFWNSHREVLVKKIQHASIQNGFKAGAFDGFIDILNANFMPQPPTYFSLIEDNLLHDYLIQKEGRIMVVSLLYVDEDVETIKPEFATIEGTFIFDTASTTKAMIKLLSNDFNLVLFACAFLVFVFLLIAFGRLELSLMAFLPMAISWIWILGIMGLSGLHFNIVNIILATFIFGMGDDYVIFITDGLMHEYTYGKKMLASYKTSIILSSLTMFIGIGILAFAQHPAMRSLGLITIIGMISVVLAAYIIPPFLFKWMTSKKGKPRIVPITIKNWIRTVVSFVVFIFGSLYLNILGFCVLTIPGVTDERKAFYHKQIQKMFRATAYFIPCVTNHTVGDVSTFKKPSIIIANHQSHLDLMYLLMLSPKIIVLTNQWVWRFPIYGKIIRYADFYPIIDEGIESSLESLKNLVAKGYSIAIFPEGTRSADLAIHRFKKGAFYLAEKLKLDIQPIIFHGIGHVLNKKEFILQKGTVTIDILPRIASDDISFGADYSERTRHIRRYMTQHYNTLVACNETVDYYKNFVYHNYIYKGRSVEQEAKKILKRSSELQVLITSLPNNGRVLIKNCGIGVVSLLCGLIKKELEIVAIDPDEDKIQLAQNCSLRSDKLTYFVAESCDFDEKDFDKVIIL